MEETIVTIGLGKDDIRINVERTKEQGEAT